MTSRHGDDTAGVCPRSDAAMLFVIGDLDEQAALDFATHRSRCQACAREVDLLSNAYDDIVQGLELEAGGDLKRRLQKRIRGETTTGSPLLKSLKVKNGIDAASYYILRHSRADDDGAWESSGVEGVFIRKLHVTADESSMTCLVRMEAGSSYPAHVHAEREECFVLEGDLRTESSLLLAGDYEHAPAGSAHGVQFTEGGCLLLIRTSLRDEFAA
ncbi:MAG TPA: cupin domain-containing protein [Planctomycetota bacterium]|nr:cupin domain-containing protein [Planctomycetota bacterium]